MGLFDRFKKGKDKPETANRDFPFDVPPNTAALVCCHVINRKEPILYASHDLDDGMWQFLCGKTHEAGDGKLIALKEVFDLDPSIGALKNIPCGCQVERKTPDDSWVIVYRETDEPIENKELSVCEICEKVKTVDHFYPAPKAYFDCLRYIQALVDSGDFEFEFKDCDTDKVKDENEHWINDVMRHVIKCKNCGQYFTCFADTYHGDGYFRIGKSEYR